MDWALIIEAFLGRLGNEGLVDGIQYGSASTYDDLQRTWRDERPLPSEAQLQAHWQNEGQAIFEAWQAQFVDVGEQVQALETKIAEVDELKTRLKKLEDDAKKDDGSIKA